MEDLKITLHHTNVIQRINFYEIGITSSFVITQEFINQAIYDLNEFILSMNGSPKITNSKKYYSVLNNILLPYQMDLKYMSKNLIEDISKKDTTKIKILKNTYKNYSERISNSKIDNAFKYLTNFLLEHGDEIQPELFLDLILHCTHDFNDSIILDNKNLFNKTLDIIDKLYDIHDVKQSVKFLYNSGETVFAMAFVTAYTYFNPKFIFSLTKFGNFYSTNDIFSRERIIKSHTYNIYLYLMDFMFDFIRYNEVLKYALDSRNYKVRNTLEIYTDSSKPLINLFDLTNPNDAYYNLDNIQGGYTLDSKIILLNLMDNFKYIKNNKSHLDYWLKYKNMDKVCFHMIDLYAKFMVKECKNNFILDVMDLECIFRLITKVSRRDDNIIKLFMDRFANNAIGISIKNLKYLNNNLSDINIDGIIHHRNIIDKNNPNLYTSDEFIRMNATINFDNECFIFDIYLDEAFEKIKTYKKLNYKENKNYETYLQNKFISMIEGKR